MLRDLIDYIQSPYPWHLAPMGYVREARLIARRAREIEAGWRGHLHSTRRSIERSIDRCENRRSVVVVGSGNLLDVPLETLCDAFERVALVDIHHAHATRRAVRGLPGVDLVAADVTGVTRAVFDAARRRDVAQLPKSAPPALAGPDVDLIVSVNILSQLSVIPCTFLTGHCPSISREQIGAFARDLVEAHLRWLRRSAERVCLVTDVVRIETFADGSTLRKDIVEGIALPSPEDSWAWHIAPRGSVYADRDVVHRVHAYPDFQGLPGA